MTNLSNASVPISVSIIVMTVGCCDEGASLGSLHSLASASVIVTRVSDSDKARANAVIVRVRFIVSTFQYGLPVRLPVGIVFFYFFSLIHSPPLANAVSPLGAIHQA